MTNRNNGGTASGDDPTSDPDQGWTQVIQRHYDPDHDGELVTAIVAAVADARGVGLREVKSPPLYECVDVTALEKTLFGGDGDDQLRADEATVQFHYAEFLVTVRSDGWIRVFESTNPDRL